MLGAPGSRIIPTRAAEGAKAARLKCIILTGDGVIEEWLPEYSLPRGWLFSSWGAEAPPIEAHVPKETGHRTWELAKINGRGKQELALRENTVRAIEVLPDQVLPHLRSWVQQAPHPRPTSSGATLQRKRDAGLECRRRRGFARWCRLSPATSLGGLRRGYPKRTATTGPTIGQAGEPSWGGLVHDVEISNAKKTRVLQFTPLCQA